MSEQLLKEIEKTFQMSNSPDELFDAFRTAIAVRITDQELYKTLLRNKALSTDEISMFADKVCREFPVLRYPISFCVGQVFSSISSYAKHHDKALYYFKKAAEAEPTTHEPYIAIANMYNPDFNKPSLDDIVMVIHDGLKTVDQKSELCFALVGIYKRLGNTDMERSFQILGEKFRREGN